MKIVLLDHATIGDVPELETLHELGEFVSYKHTLKEDTIERGTGATIILTNKVVIDREVMEAIPTLRLVCVLATGMNNIDLAAAEELGVEVKNVAGYSTNSVAQHTFAILFYLLNHLRSYDEYVQSGEYAKSEIFTNLGFEYWELTNKRFGIIGLGAIGKKVAEIATVFGAEVIYYSTTGKNTNTTYKRVELDELLQTADVISIHAPLTEQTHKLVTTEQLSKMKETAILLNTGRGGIIDEQALVVALQERQIAGVALDVLEKEPIQIDNPLVGYKGTNLLITPHIAWASKEARTKLLLDTVANIKSFLNEE